MSTKIGDSDFTIEWLETVIQKDTATKAKIINFSFSEVAHGRGIASQILIVKLTWNLSDEKLPSSVAVKIPSTKQMKTMAERNTADEVSKEIFRANNLVQIGNSLLKMVHTCEVAVYNVFRSNPPKYLKVPKCYYSQDGMLPDSQGVLVLEDFSHGAETTLIEGLSLENVMRACQNTHTFGLQNQLLQAVEQIAHLHAFSLSNDCWKCDEINVTVDKFSNDFFPGKHIRCMNALTDLKMENPSLFDPLADKALLLCQSEADITYLYDLNQKMGLPDVFVHGDFHCQNFIFEKQEQGEMGKLIAVIDWQLSHAGNIMEDISRLLVTSVSGQLRRNHWMDVLKHYYQCLEKSLARMPPYSFEKVIQSYKRCFKGAVNMSMRVFERLPHNQTIMGRADREQKTLEIHLNGKAAIEDEIEFENELQL